MILLAAAVATAPILLHGAYCGDDFEFHAAGWLDVQQSWLHGVAYPHWMTSANYGAGEPRFMFYPPLTWMLGAALGSVLPWTLTPVAMVFLFLAGTGLAVRRLAQERLADAPATLAGCAAIFSGFALFTAYERTAFAELTGGFWIPLILLYALREVDAPGGPRLSRSPSARDWGHPAKQGRIINGSVAMLALLLAGAWLSNGPVGVMASYLLGALAIASAVWSKSWAPFLRACFASALGIGMAGYSLIPAAWEQSWADLRAAVDYPVFSVENNWLFARHTDPLLAPTAPVLQRASWIAVSMIGIALAGAAVVLWRQGKSGKGFGRAGRGTTTARASEVSPGRWWVLLALIPAVVLFLQFPVSLAVWNLLPKLRFLQYPWRWVLAVEAPMGIFFAAAVWPANTRKGWPRRAVGCMCAAAFLGTTGFAARTFLRTCRDGDSMAELRALFRSGGVEGTDEYEPSGADHWLVAKGLPDACLSETEDVVLGKQPDGSTDGAQTPEWNPSQGSCLRTFTAVERAPEHMRLAMDLPRAGFLILRLVRYPAWRITLNGRPVPELPERDDGLIAVPAPRGPVALNVEWRATPDVLAGRSVSVLALGLLLWVAAIERKGGEPRSKMGRTLQRPNAQTAWDAPRVAAEHVKA